MSPLKKDNKTKSSDERIIREYIDSSKDKNENQTTEETLIRDINQGDTILVQQPEEPQK